MSEALTRNEKRFLSRFVCVWCEQRLDREECSAIYSRCTKEEMAKRRADVLKTYKPRLRGPE